MKVILIKDSKDGKANQIIEVSDGYAKNFLIKNRFALPYNESTKLALNKTLETNKQLANHIKQEALILKAELENLTLHFELKVTNMVVHGSITRKQILQQLQQKHNIKLDVHVLEAVQISSIGITIIKVILHKEVSAKLRVEVKANE